MSSDLAYRHIIHPFEPVYNRESRILILGSLPSVKSREEGFYYGHPRNRFWKILSMILDSREPETIEEKKEFLLRHRIAVYDVIQSCDIKGSSDSSIKNVVPAEIGGIIENAEIERIFANGKKAAELFVKYQRNVWPGELTTLPSSSPANAAYSLERLVKIWAAALRLEK